MSEFQIKLDQALQKLPLKALMEQRHRGPKDGRWRDFPCPYCHKKSGAGVFEGKHGELFKCHHSSCPSGTSGARGAWDAVAFLAYELSLNRTDAAITLMKEAGVWQENMHAPSVLPGQSRRKKKIPDGAYRAPKKDLPPTEPQGSSEPEPASHGSEVSAEPPSESEWESSKPAATSGPAVPDTDDSVQAPSSGSHNPGDGAGSGNGNGGGEPPAPAPDGDEPMKTLAELALDCLRDFYSGTRLTPEDRQELWTKRGFTFETSARAGFRTNDQFNYDLLVGLADRFEEEVLLLSGLWSDFCRRCSKGGSDCSCKDKSDRVIEPNRQMYGYGLIGKKPKAERKHDRDKTVWGWKKDGKCNPILIPYFDESGLLTHLRPHKGGIKDHSARFYVATRTAGQSERPCRTAVLSEGEFKGRALEQVLTWNGGKVAVGILPGIQQANNWAVLDELKTWLEKIGAENVVIAYDHEEKGDLERYPDAYQPDRRKRYDSIIWARYLAIVLNREYNARVCTLPKAWQNEQGKADWDGALAAQLRGDYVTPDPDSIWRAAAPSIHARWVKLLGEALPAKELRQDGLFNSEAEEIIQNALNQLFYKRALEHGSDREVAWAKKLRKLAKGPLRHEFGVHQLADAFESVEGWYYKCKPPQEQTVAKWEERRREARKAGDYDLAWFLDKRIEGLPVRVANFRMKCKYVLVRADGKRDSLLIIRNAFGAKPTTALVPIDARSLTAPRDFREWLKNVGEFVWKAGERELQDLQQDLAHESVDREVFQVVAFGSHDESGIWFYGDVAFAPDNRELLPDDDKIFWWNDPAGTHTGFQLGEKGSGGQDWRQKPSPRMHPGEELAPNAGSDGFQLVRQPRDDSAESERDLLREFAHVMLETLGGYEGVMIVGMTLAYGAAPELYAKYKAFPGQWQSGEKGHGKTTICQMCMELWGFHEMSSGLGLGKSCTAVGVQIAAEQYSNLPVWLDEFGTETDEQKRAIIHASYNRELESKWSADGMMRRYRTAFIVSGEHTADRAATRSRFPHVEVSKSRRKAEHMKWFEANRAFLFALGRYIMRNRVAFAKRVLELVEEWVSSAEMKGVDVRAAYVHGVGYAAFRALAELLKSHHVEDKHAISLNAYRQAMVRICIMSAGEVQAQVNVNEFWKDVLNGWQNGAFGKTPGEWKHYFRGIRRSSAVHSPGYPNQTGFGGWETWHLYFIPGAVLDALRTYKKKMGRDVALSQSDLLAQMRTKPYWVEFKQYKERSPEPHKQKFNGKLMSCWCINLDLHEEFGYRPVNDEQWQMATIKDDTGLHYTSQEFADPRLGDLYALVKAMENNEDQTGSMAA